MNGILVVDKPENTTSAKVVAIVKKLLGAGKVGHTGTLDPFATGVLICCVNRATKLSRFFLQRNKRYRAVLRVGVQTDTQDSTGRVTSVCDDLGFSETEVRAAFEKFVGTVEQVPPVYSALKHEGVPLYKLARSGSPVQKPARRVEIFSIHIEEVRLPQVRFEVSCSSGTYIRTLCADIGAALGCGGHLETLRRIESCGFSLADALTLPVIRETASAGGLAGRLIRMSDALPHMPEHIADDDLIGKIKHGNTITRSEVPAGAAGDPEGPVKILDRRMDLIAVLQYATEERRYRYCCNFKS